MGLTNVEPAVSSCDDQPTRSIENRRCMVVGDLFKNLNFKGFSVHWFVASTGENFNLLANCYMPILLN